LVALIQLKRKHPNPGCKHKHCPKGVGIRIDKDWNLGEKSDHARRSVAFTKARMRLRN